MLRGFFEGDSAALLAAVRSESKFLNICKLTGNLSPILPVVDVNNRV
jgi:hypothetical protein